MTDVNEVAYVRDTEDATPLCSHGKEVGGDCKKCADARRKRAQRAREKQEKVEAKAIEVNGQLPMRAWQMKNRSEYTKAQLDQLEAREEMVKDTLFWMEQWTSGTYDLPLTDPDFLGVDEGIRAIDDDIQSYGAVYGYDVQDQLVAAYRKGGKFLEHLKTMGVATFHRMNPTEVWLALGYLTTLPSQAVIDFKNIMRPQKSESPKYVKMICSHRQCTSPHMETVPQLIVDRYKELGTPYLCSHCKTVEQNSRAQATISIPYRKATGPEDIYDAYGRFKDQ